jgi:hypothetical protein
MPPADIEPRYLIAQDGGGQNGGAINSNATVIGDNEQFRIYHACLDKDGTAVSFLVTANKKFVYSYTYELETTENRNSSPVLSDSLTKYSAYGQFNICLLDNGRFAIKCPKGTFLSASNIENPTNATICLYTENELKTKNISNAMFAFQINRNLETDPRPVPFFETDYSFVPQIIKEIPAAIRLGLPPVDIRPRYLTAKEGGGEIGAAINSNATNIGDNEQFQIIFTESFHKDGLPTFFLMSANNKFLYSHTYELETAGNRQPSPVLSDAPANDSAWEQFKICMLDNGKIAIKCPNNNYLSATDIENPTNAAVCLYSENEINTKDALNAMFAFDSGRNTATAQEPIVEFKFEEYFCISNKSRPDTYFFGHKYTGYGNQNDLKKAKKEINFPERIDLTLFDSGELASINLNPAPVKGTFDIKGMYFSRIVCRYTGNRITGIEFRIHDPIKRKRWTYLGGENNSSQFLRIITIPKGFSVVHINTIHDSAGYITDMDVWYKKLPGTVNADAHAFKQSNHNYWKSAEIYPLDDGVSFEFAVCILNVSIKNSIDSDFCLKLSDSKYSPCDPDTSVKLYRLGHPNTAPDSDSFGVSRLGLKRNYLSDLSSVYYRNPITNYFHKVSDNDSTYTFYLETEPLIPFHLEMQCIADLKDFNSVAEMYRNYGSEYFAEYGRPLKKIAFLDSYTYYSYTAKVEQNSRQLKVGGRTPMSLHKALYNCMRCVKKHPFIFSPYAALSSLYLSMLSFIYVNNSASDIDFVASLEEDSIETNHRYKIYANSHGSVINPLLYLSGLVQHTDKDKKTGNGKLEYTSTLTEAIQATEKKVLKTYNDVHTSSPLNPFDTLAELITVFYLAEHETYSNVIGFCHYSRCFNINYQCVPQVLAHNYETRSNTDICYMNGLTTKNISFLFDKTAFTDIPRTLYDAFVIDPSDQGEEIEIHKKYNKNREADKYTSDEIKNGISYTFAKQYQRHPHLFWAEFNASVIKVAEDTAKFPKLKTIYENYTRMENPPLYFKSQFLGVRDLFDKWALFITRVITAFNDDYLNKDDFYTQKTTPITIETGETVAAYSIEDILSGTKWTPMMEIKKNKEKYYIPEKLNRLYAFMHERLVCIFSHYLLELERTEDTTVFGRKIKIKTVPVSCFKGDLIDTYYSNYTEHYKKVFKSKGKHNVYTLTKENSKFKIEKVNTDTYNTSYVSWAEPDLQNDSLVRDSERVFIIERGNKVISPFAEAVNNEHRKMLFTITKDGKFDVRYLDDMIYRNMPIRETLDIITVKIIGNDKKEQFGCLQFSLTDNKFIITEEMKPGSTLPIIRQSESVTIQSWDGVPLVISNVPIKLED